MCCGSRDKKVVDSSIAVRYAKRLNGEDYYRGKIEELEATCNNLRMAVGCLFVIVEANGHITAEEIDELLAIHCW